MLGATIVMMGHLFASGCIAFLIDEYRPEYTFTFFAMYFITVSLLSISNYFTLLAGLIHDREATLEMIDQKFNIGEK